MRLSAVVPNYNHAHLISEAVRSLSAQTLPFDEIVIVDDGSTDNSIDVVTSLANADPRIRLVRHPHNMGAVPALNTGLAEAQGEYIHFGGADDSFRPELTERTIRLLDAHPTAALASGEVLVVDRGRGIPVGLRPPILPAYEDRHFTPAMTVDLLRRQDNFIVTPSAVFRREAVVEAGGFDEGLGPFTDGYLVRQLALRHGFCFVPQVLAEWRVDDAGYSRALANEPERTFGLLKRATAAMAADALFPGWYPELFERRWRFAVERLAIEAETLADGVPRLRRLGMLTIRHRPMSLAGLAGTAWHRRSRPG